MYRSLLAISLIISLSGCMKNVGDDSDDPINNRSNYNSNTNDDDTNTNRNSSPDRTKGSIIFACNEGGEIASIEVNFPPDSTDEHLTGLVGNVYLQEYSPLVFNYIFFGHDDQWDTSAIGDHMFYLDSGEKFFETSGTLEVFPYVATSEIQGNFWLGLVYGEFSNQTGYLKQRVWFDLSQWETNGEIVSLPEGDQLYFRCPNSPERSYCRDHVSTPTQVAVTETADNFTVSVDWNNDCIGNFYTVGDVSLNRFGENAPVLNLSEIDSIHISVFYTNSDPGYTHIEPIFEQYLDPQSSFTINVSKDLIPEDAGLVIMGVILETKTGHKLYPRWEQWNLPYGYYFGSAMPYMPGFFRLTH